MKTILQQTLWKGKRVSIPIANSGVDINGLPRPDGAIGDLNYQLVSVQNGSTNVIRIRTSAGSYPIPPWLGDNSLSAWMIPNNDNEGNAPPGNYLYQTTLDLSRYDPKSVKINGQVVVDDELIAIIINGVSFPQSLAGSGIFRSFSISTGFIKNINIIGFLVNNYDNNRPANPTGFRVELNASGVKQ